MGRLFDTAETHRNATQEYAGIRTPAQPRRHDERQALLIDHRTALKTRIAELNDSLLALDQKIEFYAQTQKET